MMKIYTVMLMAFTALFTLAHAALMPMGDALQKAGKEQKLIVVVWNGSDWCPLASKFTEEFEKKSSSSKMPVIWAELDDKNKITQEEEKERNRYYPHISVWNIPAVQVVTADKQVIYMAEGLTPQDLPRVFDEVAKSVKQFGSIDKLWKQADKLKGEKAIALYGQGLAMLPFKLVPSCRTTLNKLRKLDPEDMSGAIFKATNDSAGYIDKMDKLKANPAKLQQYVDKLLTIDGLSAEQRQKLMVGNVMVAVAKKDEEGRAKVLQDIANISQETEIGTRAAAYHSFLTDKIVLEGNKFGQGEMRQSMTPIFMRASSLVNSPGTYQVTCRITSGGCQFGKAQFVSGGKVLAEQKKPVINKQVITYTLALKEAPSDIQLSVEMKGRGWFAVDGEILIEPVTKP